MGNPNEKPKLRRMAIMPPNGESKYGKTPQWVEKATKDFLDFLPEENHIKELPYTKPKLRERIKRRIMQSSNGGRPGQWSARKAQLLAQEYRKAGGGYRGKPRKQQQALNKWTKEKWRTADNKPAFRRGKMSRYLPAKAWQRLTPAQRRATISKKLQGEGQFVPNTERAAEVSKAIRGKALGTAIGASGGTADSKERQSQTGAKKPAGTTTPKTPSGRTNIGGGTSSSSQERYNPKARDGDGDGNVQEGTDFERQAETTPQKDKDKDNNPPVNPTWLDQGKIDMSKRQPVYLGKGQYGVVAPILIYDDNKYVIIPTIDEKGKQLNNAETMGIYQKFNDHLGKFDNIDDAQKYLGWLKNQEKKQISKYLDDVANGNIPEPPAKPGTPTPPQNSSLDDINWDDFAKLVEGEARKLKPGQQTDWNSGQLPNGGIISEDGTYIPAPLEKGNIDLSKRKGVQLPDGTTATIRSISINEDGKEVLIPSIGPNGENWDPRTKEGLASAIEQYKNSGQHLGKFSNVQEADIYGEWLHEQEAKRIDNTPQVPENPATPPNMPAMPNAKIKPVKPNDRAEGSGPRKTPQAPQDTPTERRRGTPVPAKPSLLIPPMPANKPPASPTSGIQLNPPRPPTTTAPVNPKDTLPPRVRPTPPARMPIIVKPEIGTAASNPPTTTQPPAIKPEIGTAISNSPPIRNVGPKERGEGAGRTQVGPGIKPKISEGIEERRVREAEKRKEEAAKTLDTRFVRGSYDAGRDLEVGDAWTLWENPEIDSLKDGQVVLLTNVFDRSDFSQLQKMDYAIAQRVNGTIVVSELDAKAYDTLKLDSEKNIEDTNFNSSKQYRKMEEVSGGFQDIKKVFPDLSNPMKQIIISNKPAKEDAARQDGFIVQGQAMSSSKSYAIFPGGMNTGTDALKQIVTHETAHILQAKSNFGGTQSVMNFGWDDARYADSVNSQNIIDERGFTSTADVQGEYHAPQIGSLGITPYGETNAQEDWAESFMLYVKSYNENGIGTDSNGQRVTFEQMYPNRAKIINKWMESMGNQNGQ